jgi:large subunit ribosomal protein L3
MAIGMIAKKLGMTQVFNDNGDVIPVTIIQAGPCQILETKNQEKHGYSAIKLSFEEKVKDVNKPNKGYFESLSKLANKTITPKKYIKEFRVEDSSAYKIGDVINPEIFADGELIDVVGISKGKGFQGVMKRYHFHGGPETHGSKFHRKPGAIGAHTFPGRVWKGQKMPGHMGCDQITVKNLRIFKIDAEKNLIFLQGAVPGGSKSIIYLNKKNK